jgi:pyruvate kinase
MFFANSLKMGYGVNMTTPQLFDIPLTRTKVICTIGPSCWEKDQMAELADNGMNVARLNFSHGERKQHQESIDKIHAINEGRLLKVAIMQDTKGAEIRTGDVDEKIKVEVGDDVVFSPSPLPKEKRAVIIVSYDGFSKDALETDVILIDNGEIYFDIISVEKNGSVIAKAQQSGAIGSRRHISLPGADIDLPSITEKDWEDIRFGAEQNIDFIALSFVRTGAEVDSVRKLLKTLKSTSKLISKIETKKAVENIQEIIDASDAIMVARGDLGSDLPFEQLPVVQDEIVCRCKDAGKPVIIATQMLESMMEHPMPTRAEVTDTAHAVSTGTDATMLSGETAAGIHPVLVLKAMKRIHKATEAHLARLEIVYDIRFSSRAEEEMDSAVKLAEEQEVEAIVLLSDTGRTARHIAKFRPAVPLITLVSDPVVQMDLTLVYGCYPLLINFDESDEVTMDNGVELALKSGLIQKGQRVLLLRDRANKPEVVNL